jgi:hypothetical protein
MGDLYKYIYLLSKRFSSPRLAISCNQGVSIIQQSCLEFPQKYLYINHTPPLKETHPHLHEAQKASNATTWVALLALVP